MSKPRALRGSLALPQAAMARVKTVMSRGMEEYSRRRRRLREGGSEGGREG